MTPKVDGILETALYVDDIERSIAFYKKVFGFDTLTHGERICALSVAGRDVLLVFKKGGSVRPTEIPGGVIPPTDADGHIHMAFAIARESLEDWRGHLERSGVEIESTVTWSGGGTSLYFRDPDQHTIELVTPGTWEIY